MIKQIFSCGGNNSKLGLNRTMKKCTFSKYIYQKNKFLF